jgi:hypothetical protein
MKIKFDANGNRALVIETSDLAGARGFSIQALGNLPETHRNGVGQHTEAEVRAYLAKHGTPRQRKLYGITENR